MAPTAMAMSDWMAEWRRGAPVSGADWQKWFSAFRAPPGFAASPLAGTGAPWFDAGAAASVYTELARELTRFAALVRSSSPREPAATSAELTQFAQRLFSQALPRWPAADAALPEWARALETINAVLADAARDAATRYAALLRAEAAPTTLRGLFDAWIDCAEAAFQSVAHTERYASAQAALLNEFVTLCARQQELAERASRALGQPTRAEVDALHSTLRELKAELAALRVAKPPA